jgi:hypothetical protein
MKNLLFICSSLLLILFLQGCNTIKDEITNAGSDSTDTQGFYTLNSNNFSLKYKVVNHEFLECRLTGNGTGWVAVGFDAQNMMQDVNFIISAYSNGAGTIRDDFGTSQTSHAADVYIGGTNDVTLISAVEEANMTTIGFIIPLDSGDSKDRPLAIGSTYNVIFARGADDDFNNIHTARGSGVINIRD